MGQQQIYSFLKKNKNKWFDSREIAKKLKISPSSVAVSLKLLRKNKFIFFREKQKWVWPQSHRKVYEYKFK